MRDRGRWGGGPRWGDGRRPPWWPEGEPWPPIDGAPWRRMRRRFMWRFGCFFLAFILLVGTLVAVVAWLVGGVLDGPSDGFLWGALSIVAVVFILALAVRLARRTGAPVGDLIEGAGRLEAGEVGTQVPERGPREVRSVARAFNAMSARLEATDSARRRLLADVSHELRTPLTVMQGTLEGMLDGLYPMDAAHLAPVLDETRVLARLVDDLRTLSLSEAGSLRLYREPTDLGRLAVEVAAAHRVAATAAGVTLHVPDPAPRVLVEVDPSRIRQVIGNLLANAVRFTPSGGEVRVTLEPGAEEAAIVVTDSGEGMSPGAVEQAFDRFYRSPGSPGSGLGLAIAKNLVEAHGGRIEIRSEVGQGTTVRFAIPRGQPA